MSDSYIKETKNKILGFFLLFFLTAFLCKILWNKESLFKSAWLININSWTNTKKYNYNFLLLKFWISKEFQRMMKEILGSFYNIKKLTRKQQKYLLFYQNFIDSSLPQVENQVITFCPRAPESRINEVIALCCWPGLHEGYTCR